MTLIDNSLAQGKRKSAQSFHRSHTGAAREVRHAP